MLATALAAAVYRAGTTLDFWQVVPGIEAGFEVVAVAAYVWASVFCWRIANDHRGSPAMRRAWILFTASSVSSVTRHFLLALAASRLSPDFQGAGAYLPTQIPMAIALVLLFSGLVMLWNVFYELRLRFEPRQTDIIAMILMLLTLPAILIRNRERLPAGMPAWAWILPLAGALLLPACGAVAILLHRIARRLWGGMSAQTVLLLAVFPLARLVAMLLAVDPHLKRIPLLVVVGFAISKAAPLLFTLAVAYRWEITLRAAAAMESEFSAPDFEAFETARS